MSSKTHRRFDRAARLIGDDGLARLSSATVTVIGLGGVGSFAAEALCRSGVGRLILVDFDRVCVTNTNRQLHTMKGTLGKPKVDVMAERLRAINPDAVIETRREFYSDKTADRLLVPEPDVVVDAIDNVKAKLHLIAGCIRGRIRLVSSMGAAARVDPTRVRVADLSRTRVDPFARHLRKDLRRKWGIDASRPLGVLAVYSEETPRAPRPLAYDQEGYLCVCPGGQNGLHDCDHGSRVDGSLPFVPAAFGMTLASVAVRLLTENAISPEVSAPSTDAGTDLSSKMTVTQR